MSYFFRYVAVLSMLALSGAAGAASVGEGKKLLEFGWDTPNMAYLAVHGRELDAESPFDGLITSGTYTVNGKKRDFSWFCFGREKIPAENERRWIAELRAAGLKRMTDNFLRYNTMPGDIDWFDDFSAVIHNARLLARVARDGGTKGFMLDFEEYARRIKIAPFTYEHQKLKDTRTFAQYAAQVKQRGREFGAAITDEFPNAILLITHAHSFPFDQMAGAYKLEDMVYGLLPAFIDGMLEGADPRATFVDAYEKSYGYRDLPDFRMARDLIHKSVAISSDPKLYAQRMRIGFGLRIDYTVPRPSWDLTDFTRNYFTPDEFEYAVFSALKASDQYVWIYSEHPNWWSNDKLPREYRRALENSRQDHELKRARRRSLLNEPGAITNVSSKTTPGSDDASAFGDLWADYEEVSAVPRKWKFALDPGDMGIENRWFAPELDDSGWKEIETGVWWEPQGYTYDGVAWYRLRIEIPADARGQSLWLAFGAADDAALVYVNGVKAGEHDGIAHSDFGRRFLIDITKQARPGEANLVAVRVMDRLMLGGLWKSVKLITKRQGYDLRESPDQTHSVADEHPDVVAGLRKDLYGFLEQCGTAEEMLAQW